MSIDPDRLADLVARKLGALVRHRWPDVAAGATGGSFPGGSTLVEPGGRAWILLDGDGQGAGEAPGARSDAARRLGACLAVARRSQATEVHLLVEDGDAARILARRARCFADPPTVWRVVGLALSEAEPAAPAVAPAVAPEAELYRPVLLAAGLTPIDEGGNLVGELLGLEVARVVVDDDGSARVEAGVGRFDREAGAMLFAHQGETDALARVVELVAGIRTATAARHPLNQLVPERWMRAALVAEPERVGAERLVPVPSALARRNLLEVGVASAHGTDREGNPIVVTCSTGVDLDLVPAAADDRLSVDPGARLVLAVPARDVLAVTVELASRLIPAATVMAVEDGWRSVAEGRT